MLDSIPSEKRMCHRCGFEKSCRKLVMDGACERWSRIEGTHPQTGAHMEKWACIDDHIPFLLLDIGKLTKEAGAATEDMRNEITTRMDNVKPMVPMASHFIGQRNASIKEIAVQPDYGEMQKLIGSG